MTFDFFVRLLPAMDRLYYMRSPSRVVGAPGT